MARSACRRPALSALLLVLSVWPPGLAVRAAAAPGNQLNNEPISRTEQSMLLSLVRHVHSRLGAFETLLDDFRTQLGDVRTQQHGFRTQHDVRTQLDDVRTQLGDFRAQLGVRLTELTGRLDALQAPDRLTALQAPDRLPRDCSDLPRSAAHSGVHLLRPSLEPSQPPVAAFCDMETDGGGWTIIQRRADISPREDFFRGWAAYREGFGELDAEFWWGLRHLRALTAARDRRYQLRVELEDFNGGRRHAVYQGFRISSEEDGYRLRAVNYTGDAGDSLGHHSGQRFTTMDRDQDKSDKANCAELYKGAWWYSKCYDSNLNGEYLVGQHDDTGRGVIWLTWRGNRYSLKAVTMMIRPSKKLL